MTAMENVKTYYGFFIGFLGEKNIEYKKRDIHALYSGSNCRLYTSVSSMEKRASLSIFMIIMVSECLFEILSLGYGLLNYLIINYWYLK